MSPFRLLAVSAVLLTAVAGMPGVSGTRALAVNPQAAVWTNNSLWASVGGDSYTASAATVWERGFDLSYRVQSGTVTGPSVQITLPNGLDYMWATAPVHVNWTGATNTLTGTWPGIPPNEMSMGVDAIPPYSVGAPPVSVSRSISDPVLTGDLQTRTVTLDVTVNSSLAGYNSFNANLAGPWEVPQGMAYTVGAPTLPAGFSANADPGSYYSSNPSALVVGNTYHFAADVQFSRSGPLAQATVGNLYYKPESGVSYGVVTNVAPASGTSIAMTAAPGVVATFSSLTPTGFTGSTWVGNGLGFSCVSAGVGPAAPSLISVARVDRSSVSGTILYEVNAEIKGANIIAGTFTVPGGAVYGLTRDTESNSWRFDFGSTAESDLDNAGFGAGNYYVDLKGSDDVIRRYTVVGPAKDVPAGMPQFSQAMGFDTTDKRQAIGWLAAADSNVTKNYVEMYSDADGGYEYMQMLDEAVTSHTPTEDLGLGAWYVMVAYSDHTETFTLEGVPLQIDFATATEGYFNVTPEPATLALLALGGMALFRRRPTAYPER